MQIRKIAVVAFVGLSSGHLVAKIQDMNTVDDAQRVPSAKVSDIGIQRSVELQSNIDGATILIDISTPECTEPVVHLVSVIDSNLNRIYESRAEEGACSSHLDHKITVPGIYIIEHHYGLKMSQAAQSSSFAIVVTDDWTISRTDALPTDVAIEVEDI